MAPLEVFIDVILPAALELTQPLTEMSTRNISWAGKGGRCVGLTTLPPSRADCLEIWETQTQGLYRPVMGLLYLFTTLVSYVKAVNYRTWWTDYMRSGAAICGYAVSVFSKGRHCNID